MLITMRFLLVLLLSAIISVCFSDGIPVHNGKITVPHTIIDLTKSQQEEVAVLGTLTLTDTQWALLRKKGPACPKRFDVVFPIDYDDCTCADPIYVVRLSSNKAAILNSDIQRAELDELIVLLKNGMVPMGSQWLSDKVDTSTFQIGTEGEFYIRGILIPYADLLNIVSTPRRLYYNQAAKSTSATLSLKLAPGANAESPAIRERCTKLQEAARKGHWEIYCSFKASWNKIDDDDLLTATE
jgi:hypothetical protein